MAQLADILLVTSIILFLIGVLVGIIGPLRRALPLINTKLRLRHFFVVSLFIFIVSFAFGWQCFKAGLEGCGEPIHSEETVSGTQPIKQNSE
jgi:hypothetical protein